MKILIAALLSVALISVAPTEPTHINKQVGSKPGVHKAILAHAIITPQTQPVAEVAPVPVPAPPPPVAQGCAAYVPLLQQYDWNVQIMSAVMDAESGCNPNAVSPPNWDGIRDYGIMQLHGQEIYDPATNIAHAYSLWTTQGYHAWSTYNSGAYLRYE